MGCYFTGEGYLDDNGAPCGPNPGGSGGTSNSGGNDWLSGISDIFTSVGTTFASIYKAANPPPAPKVVTPYYTATGVNPTAASFSSLFSNPIVLIGGLLVVFLLLRKR